MHWLRKILENRQQKEVRYLYRKSRITSSPKKNKRWTVWSQSTLKKLKVEVKKIETLSKNIQANRVLCELKTILLWWLMAVRLEISHNVKIMSHYCDNFVKMSWFLTQGLTSFWNFAFVCHCKKTFDWIYIYNIIYNLLIHLYALWH